MRSTDSQGAQKGKLTFGQNSGYANMSTYWTVTLSSEKGVQISGGQDVSGVWSAGGLRLKVREGLAFLVESA